MKGVGKDTIVNIIGRVLPTIVMLPITPLYLHIIGSFRYGVLMVFWTFVGYFGALDLGLGQAIANRVPQIPYGDKQKSALFWTAVALALLFGIFVGGIILIVGQFFLTVLFKLSLVQFDQIKGSMWFIAAMYPLVAARSVFSGVLRGERHFIKFNLITGVSSVLVQIVPLSFAVVTNKNFFWIIVSTTMIQGVGIFWMLYECLAIPDYRRRPVINKIEVSHLLRYGSWVSVSSIIGPLLVGLDRIIISIKMGAGAVPFYVIPSNAVTQLQIIPGSLTSSLFPQLSVERIRNTTLPRESLQSLAVVLIPIAILTMIFVGPFLSLWISPQFAKTASPIAEILIVGVVINSMAHLPYVYLTAKGRPDIVAKFHAVEIIPFIAILLLSIHLWGLEGAAWAWVIRVTGDALLLFAATRKISWGIPQIGLGVIILIVAFGLVLGVPRASLLIPLTSLFLVSVVWTVIFAPSVLRQLVKSFIVGLGARVKLTTRSGKK